MRILQKISHDKITQSTKIHSGFYRRMKAVTRTIVRKSSFYKFGHILDLILPILEWQVNVITQLVNHILSSVGMANDSHSLFT